MSNTTHERLARHRKTRPLPSQEQLNMLLRYDPVTGKLFWNRRPPVEFKKPSLCDWWNKHHAGAEAFTAIDKQCYRGCIYGQTFLAHRVIFKMLYDQEPPQIDHINGNRLDNRAVNLRAATNAINCKNMPMPCTNTTGHVGVIKKGRRWAAQIEVDNKYVYLGRYATKEEAAAARRDAEDQYGFHPNHGRSHVTV